MRKTAKKQSGLSFIGLCLTLGILAIFVLFILSAFPLYNEYFVTKTVMNAVSKLPPDRANSNQEIYSSLIKNARINSLERLSSGAIKEIVTITNDRKAKKKLVNVKFQATSPLFKNLHLMLHFDETIEISTQRQY